MRGAGETLGFWGGSFGENVGQIWGILGQTGGDLGDFGDVCGAGTFEAGDEVLDFGVVQEKLRKSRKTPQSPEATDGSWGWPGSL